MTNKEAATEVSTEVNSLPQLPVAYSAESLEDLFAKVKAEVEAHVPDLETVEGRKHIKSLAAKISSSKTAIDKPMRDYLREIKALPKVVEKNARESVERFDALRDATLKPLTEAQEEQDAIIAEMDLIVASIASGAVQDSHTAFAMLDSAESVDVDTTFWPELHKKARASVDGALAAARSAVERLEAAEKQAAELEELRRKQAENEQRERDRLIAEAAAQKARDEEQKRAEQRILDERNKAEQSRLAELASKQQAEESERRRVAQEEAAKQAAIAAEEAAKLRAEQAAKDATEKAQREADEQRKREAEELERREQDKSHRTAVNRAALVDLIAHAGIDEETAKKVITAVATKKVSGMGMKY